MQTILAFGEVMVELAPAGDSSTQNLKALNFAGDTFNTAVYLARLGVDAGYMTRLGDDLYSQKIVQLMDVEGVSSSHVILEPGRVPGLYMIENSASGERSFSYWRGQAPARELFAKAEELEQIRSAIFASDFVYFSGISLAILSDVARDTLFEVLSAYKQQGGKIIFDNNYRPRLWQSVEEAQSTMERALKICDMALLTDDDEKLLWGDADLAATQVRLAEYGIPELVIKRGPDSVFVKADGSEQFVEIPVIEHVVDTTAAGDSFNAGYLAARVQNAEVADAVLAGAKTAGFVIQHRGAIVSRVEFLAEFG